MLFVLYMLFTNFRTIFELIAAFFSFFFYDKFYSLILDLCRIRGGEISLKRFVYYNYCESGPSVYT